MEKDFNTQSSKLNHNMKHILSVIVSLLFALQVTAAVSGKVTVEWQRSSDDVGDITYRVYRGTSSGVYEEQFNVGTNTTYTFLDLVPGVTYYFAATAIRDDLESILSNEASHQSPLGQPVTSMVGVTFRRDATNVVIAWTPNPTNQIVSQYEIEYKPTNAVSYASSLAVAPPVTIPVDSTSTYNFRIRAIGSSGVGPWLERIIPVLPGPPRVLLVKVNGDIQYIYSR